MAIDENQKLHFIMLPLMAQGHMIPMVDIAILLAQRGLTVTILTTPHNASRFQTVVDLAGESGLKIHVINLKFPCAEAGLPEGCENLDMITSAGDGIKFMTAVAMLKDQVEHLLTQEIKPSPSCLIADMWFTWATKVALKLKIPRIMFYGTSCFSLLCKNVLELSEDFQSLQSDSDYFVVPGLPDRIEVTKAQFKATFDQLTPEWTSIWDKLRESEVDAFGTIVNSFDELEFEYIKNYYMKAWCIGPVSLLCNKDGFDKVIDRGNKASISEHECLKWLDSQEKSSVIYVCLGSLSRMDASQLKEIGLGLEASNRPFVWVTGRATEEFGTWILEEKFEERINGKGLLIHGWAPQVLILSHPSIGGFLTHCGWNSTLEGITAGLPMITWPLFAEQFFNEKLIVNVIKIGVSVGVVVPVFIGEDENVGGLVKSDEIKRAIERLMDEGEGGEERRRRAEKLAEMAKGAVEEGGSSHRNMTMLIQDVIIQLQANYLQSS